jgi:hypothetical protein
VAVSFAEQLMHAATACYERDEPHAAHICRQLAATVVCQQAAIPNSDDEWLNAAITIAGEEC